MSRTSYMVGLDLHKKSISYCIKTPSGRIVEKGRMRSNPDEIDRLAGSIRPKSVVGMEATMFTGWVYDRFRSHGFEVKVGHPLMLRAIAVGKKNDEIDAETICDLLRTGFFPECYIAPREIRSLREVMRLRNMIVMMAVKLKNRIAGTLMGAGIEYNKEKLHGKRYFVRLMDSLDWLPGETVEILRDMKGGVEFLESLQKKLRRGLAQDPRLKERIELLMSVPGVGEVTALTWALEIADPHRFRDSGELISYCGLCSRQKSSGGKDMRGPLTKQRNAHLQPVLIEAAKLAPRYNPWLNEIHERELARGHRNRATIMVARKLASCLLSIDKSGRPFKLKNIPEGGKPGQTKSAEPPVLACLGTA